MIAALVALSGVAAAFVVAFIVGWTSRHGQQRNPLTQDLLRSPGYTLRKDVDAITLDIVADFMCLTLVSSFAALGFSVLDRGKTAAAMHSVVILLFIAGFGFFTISLSRRWHRRARLRLALDGEMATGEELNRLMLRGCHVFHDVPADRFNIDHVVVGSAGVFAVETKARSKRPRGTGAQGATVTQDGTLLRFPGRDEREPLEQAKRQAHWVHRWLTSAIGEPVDVTPVLALPGWYVERKAPAEVLVINPKNPTFLAEPRGGKEFAAQMVQRIAHQLEQRCRDVVPLAFRDQRADRKK